MTKRDTNSVRSKEDLLGFSKRRLYGKSLVSSFRFFHEIDRFQVMSSSPYWYTKKYLVGAMLVHQKSPVRINLFSCKRFLLFEKGL